MEISQSSRIRYRTPNSEESELLLSMFRDHALYEGHKLPTEGKLELLREMLHNNDAPFDCYFIETEEGVVGYMSLLKQFSTWDLCHYLYLDCLYLTPKARGKGIGALVISKIKDIAVQKGAAQIQWQTPVKNIGAIKFYEREGAMAKPKQRFFLEL